MSLRQFACNFDHLVPVLGAIGRNRGIFAYRMQRRIRLNLLPPRCIHLNIHIEMAPAIRYDDTRHRAAVDTLKLIIGQRCMSFVLSHQFFGNNTRFYQPVMTLAGKIAVGFVQRYVKSPHYGRLVDIFVISNNKICRTTIISFQHILRRQRIKIDLLSRVPMTQKRNQLIFPYQTGNLGPDTILSAKSAHR